MDVFFVNGHYLDDEQREAILCDSKYLLLLAGAGTGKTMTIVGKVRYLVSKGVSTEEILCISFTNATVNNLKNIFNRYQIDVAVFTFHKLALLLISEYKTINIVDDDFLKFIIDEYFSALIFQDEIMLMIVLYYFNKFIFIDPRIAYTKISYNDLSELKKIVLHFIKLFKTNNFNNKLFLTIYENTKFKDKCLVLIIYRIYNLYQEELKASLLMDFDDMILEATDIIKRYGINRKYKYIIVDEFQDTSLSKYLLLKTLLDVSSAHLFAVGDDFQSIYKFTGCDLDLFLNFDKYYPGGVIKRISTTYRNSNQLIKCSSSFVMKNPRQMKKNLVAVKENLKPFKFVFYKDKKQAFIKLLSLIDTEIMVIGRNKFDINSVLSIDMIFDGVNIKYLDKVICYYTAHASKGLEAENTILINNESSIYGFPSKVKNAKVFDFIYKKDDFAFEEERRLFYVALTRSKNNTYLMIPYFAFSSFIFEFIFDYYKYIEFYFY